MYISKILFVKLLRLLGSCLKKYTIFTLIFDTLLQKNQSIQIQVFITIHYKYLVKISIVMNQKDKKKLNLEENKHN